MRPLIQILYSTDSLWSLDLSPIVSLFDWLIYCYFCWGSLRADLYTSPGDNTTNALSLSYNLCGKSREIFISMIPSKSPLKFGLLCHLSFSSGADFQGKTTDRWFAGELKNWYHKTVKLDAAQLVGQKRDHWIVDWKFVSRDLWFYVRARAWA